MMTPSPAMEKKGKEFLAWASSPLQFDRVGPLTHAPKNITILGGERLTWQYLGFCEVQHPEVLDFSEAWERADITLAFILFLKVSKP